MAPVIYQPAANGDDRSSQPKSFATQSKADPEIGNGLAGPSFSLTDDDSAGLLDTR